MQLEGGCTIRQDGREARLAPGQFAIYDTRRPYELVLEEDYQQAVLRVPCRTLRERLGGSETLTACAVSAEALPARLLTQMVRETCNAAPPRPASGTALDVADALLAVLSGGLRELREDEAPGSGALARVKAYVAAHLCDPALSVPRITAALGLSRSTLHRLFRVEGRTLERWIWSERLAACERALRDPRQARRTLTEIAYAHAFSDAAHSAAASSAATASRPRPTVARRAAETRRAGRKAQRGNSEQNCCGDLVDTHGYTHQKRLPNFTWGKPRFNRYLYYITS